jgi:hypothetical protein
MIRLRDPVALGLAFRVPVFPRRLDAALHRFGAGIGEEHRIGEGRVDQAFGQALLFRDLVEIRQMPHASRLRFQRGNELHLDPSVAMSQEPSPRSNSNGARA